jgi:hypothetical protein
VEIAARGHGWRKEDKYLRKYNIYIIYIYVAVDLGSFSGMAYLVGVWKISKHKKKKNMFDY